MPYCLDCSFIFFPVAMVREKPVSLLLLSLTKGLRLNGVRFTPTFLLLIAYDRARFAWSLLALCQDLIRGQLWVQSLVQVILTRSFMSRKNNFDLTKLIVGSVSNLTWHNANNDKNPTRGAVIWNQHFITLSFLREIKGGKFTSAKQSWFKGDVTRDDF